MLEQLVPALLTDTGTAGLCALALLAEARSLAVVARRHARARTWRWLAAVPLVAGALALLEGAGAGALLWVSLLAARPGLLLAARVSTQVARMALEVTMGATLLLLVAGMVGLAVASLCEGRPVSAQ